VFTGTVVETRYLGTEASVRTDSGALVVVRGYIGRDPGLGSSVDRVFREGRRYKFHPVNARSPFRDNACTRTHRIRGSFVGNLLGPAWQEPEVNVAPEAKAVLPLTPADDDDGSLVPAATAGLSRSPRPLSPCCCFFCAVAD